MTICNRGRGKADFIEMERVDGFLIFKAEGYRAPMERYDRSRGELIALEHKIAGLEKRRKIVATVLKKERLCGPSESDMAFLTEFFKKEWGERIRSFESEFSSLNVEIDGLRKLYPMKREKVRELQQRIPSSTKVVDLKKMEETL